MHILLSTLSLQPLNRGHREGGIENPAYSNSPKQGSVQELRKDREILRLFCYIPNLRNVSLSGGKARITFSYLLRQQLGFEPMPVRVLPT